MKTRLILANLVLFAAFPSQAPAALLWWSSLDGNADAIVGADGVPTGTPLPAMDLNGNPGGAVSFDGLTQFYTIVPSQTSFTAGSLSIWALPANFANSESGPFSVGASGGGTDQYFALHRAWRGDLDDGVARLDVASNVTAPTNVWQHVVLTFAAQGQLRMYVNGALQNDVQSLAAAASTYNFTHSWILGAERSAEVNRFFAGTLDDARIWNHELTQSEVSDIFAAGPTFVPEPAVGLMAGMFGFVACARRRRGN